ncbi:MAG: hypothetical protein EAX96_17505 [Candidatus Lokiarchaeota archaeon]|nr:hypothetical protein [Candidatus Lokiarchaeota archaeon]
MDMMNLEEHPELQALWNDAKIFAYKPENEITAELVKGWIDYYTDKLKEMENFPEDITEFGRYYLEAQVDEMKEKIAALKKSYDAMNK